MHILVPSSHANTNVAMNTPVPSAIDKSNANVTATIGGKDFGKIEPMTLLGHVFKIHASSAWEYAKMNRSFIYFHFVVDVCRCAGVRMKCVILFDIH